MNNLFFFWGEEDFLINLEIEKIKSKNIDKNFETMAYKRLYKPCFDDVITSVQSIPMMFGNIMHVIDMNKFLLNGEEDSAIEDWQLKSFEEALKNKSEKNIVVLRCIIPSDSKKKVDARKKIYKIISKYAEEKQFHFYKDFDKNLPKIIMELGADKGLKISANVASFIIKQIGVNLGIINKELEKLAITLYPNTTPRIEDIENICTNKDDVFIIWEYIFNKNIDKALFEFKKVLEKSELIQIVGALHFSLRNSLIIKGYYHRLGRFELAKRLHVPDFIVEKNYKSMSNISMEELIEVNKNFIKAEYLLKKGECVTPETLIEMVLMRGFDV